MRSCAFLGSCVRLDDCVAEIIGGDACLHVVIVVCVHPDKEGDGEEKGKRKNERSDHAAIWARWLEHISRLSLIAALARDQINPVISVDDLRWARAVVDHCIEMAIRSAKDFISDGDYEKVSKKVQIIAREAGVNGIAERDLNKKARSIEPKLRNIVIGDLLNQGFIARVEVGTGRKGGRPGLKYRIEN